MSYKDTQEIFDDLMNLYLVYVPSVISSDKNKDELYLFARFFAVINNDDANRFHEDFKDIELAEVLVRMYNEAVFDESVLEAYSKYPYYTERDYLEDKAEFEQEKAEWEQEKVEWRHEKAGWEQKKVEWGQEKADWSQKRVDWEQKRTDWEQKESELLRQIAELEQRLLEKEI